MSEFTMKDSYSLDADARGLDRQYQAHIEAYQRIFHRCGLPVTVVRADVGMMGGSEPHEFMYLSDIGEDTIAICDDCGHAANRQVARFDKGNVLDAVPEALAEVVTPGATTIEEEIRAVGRSPVMVPRLG